MRRPPGSASTKLFPAVAEAAGFDASKVEQLSVAPSLQEQMLIQGQVAGALVFNVTAYINLLGQGRDPDADFRWFSYGEAGLDIYSNGVMVSQALIDDKPEAVAGLVRAINRAVQDTIADPDAALAVLAKEEPLLDIAVERKAPRLRDGEPDRQPREPRARHRRSRPGAPRARHRHHRGDLRAAGDAGDLGRVLGRLPAAAGRARPAGHDQLTPAARGRPFLRAAPSLWSAPA